MTAEATEKQVRMAARMYEMRDTARRMLGDNYAAHMMKMGVLLEAAAKRRGIEPLSIAIEAAKEPGASATDVMMIMAAVVELTEPSPRIAA